MSLIKLGEAITVGSSNFHSEDSIVADAEMLQNLEKFASELKMIAPKAKDFTYFSCIMMHSAEASLLNSDGTLRKDAEGKEVTAHWEKKGDSWRWVCSDNSIKPYRNNNGDIFPEEELLKAYKKWVGKPLCLDHKSSSVDMVRGLVVDTIYDRPNRRVIALCALDKKNYPDLARKVATGYATSVSMGTAVEKAICSDCGTVAKVESEFCDCMRNKRCYGEINTGLNPLELSIVVSGADPKAKIRHVVAAANNIAQYISDKEKELSVLSSDEAQDVAKAEEIEKGLEKAISDLEVLKKEVQELKSNEQAELEEEIKEEKTKEEEMQEKESNISLKDVYIKLGNLTKQVEKLTNKLGEDKTMTKKEAYFLGGGGVNEPTPGKPKYEKEDSDSIRANMDKQMVGQMDTGPANGMHPGYDSMGESEEALKKRILRAEEEERALRREAYLQAAKEKIASKKEAYLNGGGGVNEPTPGKAKYPKEDADKIRDKEDKQMVGESPFPGVGKTDGLYGDDEKKKKMLARAKLTAKFTKAAYPDGTDNLADSRWHVYADDKIILTATVKDITNNKVDALYDSVATKDFGLRILNKIRVDGFDKAASMLKSAELTPPPAAAEAAPVGPAPEAAALPAAPEMPEAPEADVDAGGAGDPKADVKEVLDRVENDITDLRQGVEALMGESGNELKELGDLAAADDSAAADDAEPTVASLLPLKQKLSTALMIGMKKAIKDLESHAEELKMAQHIYDNEKSLKKADIAYVNTLAVDAVKDAKVTLADCTKVMEAFVKYARGTENLVKKAAKENEMKKLAEDPTKGVAGKVYEAGDPFMPLDATPGVPYKPKKDGAGSGMSAKPAVVAPKPAPQPAAKPAAKPNELPEPYGDRSELETMLINNVRETPMGGKFQTPQAPKPSGQMADDCAMADDSNEAMVKKPDGTEIKLEGDELQKALASDQFDLSTKEGRAQMRAKLAEKVSFAPVLNQAHSGGVTTKLDIKPEGDLAKVETLEEQHKKIVDMALASPKVRKQAEDIQKLVAVGKIDPANGFDDLIKAGLDTEAVKYWKQLYGQAPDGGSQFAAELVKGTSDAKIAEEKEAYRVKIARSYELAYNMVRKGMIGDDRHAINEQVNEIMKYNDEAFESMARWVNRQESTVKTASIPQVGLMGTGELTLPAPEAAQSDFVTNLEAAFRGRKY